jgi:RimJ/RimL family protein N-acetyltransferase
VGDGYHIFFKNALVGSVGFVHLNEKHKNCEIGYWLDAKHNGLGIMTKSTKMLEDFAFEKLGCERVEIKCDEKNEKSAGVPERLGYKLDGILRKERYGCGPDKKKLTNTMIWSKLKSEWMKENAKRA